jgi:hypothetical protein
MSMEWIAGLAIVRQLTIPLIASLSRGGGAGVRLKKKTADRGAGMELHSDAKKTPYETRCSNKNSNRDRKLQTN